jgi:hypothetical protein
MRSQEQLSEIFIHAERHRSDGGSTVTGWGSNRREGKDSLWNAETKEHWERDNPNGLWYAVPPIGRDGCVSGIGSKDSQGT